MVKKIIEELGITEELAKNAIYYEHVISKLTRKKDLETVDFEITPGEEKFFKKICSKLKISMDGLVTALLVGAINNGGKYEMMKGADRGKKKQRKTDKKAK